MKCLSNSHAWCAEPGFFIWPTGRTIGEAYCISLPRKCDGVVLTVAFAAALRRSDGFCKSLGEDRKCCPTDTGANLAGLASAHHQL